MKQVDQNKQ